MTTITKEKLFSSDPVAYRGPVQPGGEDQVVLLKATQADLDYVFGDGDDDGAEAKGLFARLVIACLGNEDGTRMFSKADYNAVSKIPLMELQPIASLIQERCGFTAIGADLEGKS